MLDQALALSGIGGKAAFDYDILPASWRDLGALQYLERETFPIDLWPLWDLIGILTLPNIVRLKVVVRGQMIAFAALEYKAKEQADWITTIGVLPRFQKRGIGASLLEACEHKSKGSVIRLCVRASNRAAQRLYLGSSYQIVQTWKAYYHDGEDALMMEKVLHQRGNS